MQITATMDLNQLPELVGQNFTPQQLRCLRDLLNQTKYEALGDVPPAVWLSMLERTRLQFMRA